MKNEINAYGDHIELEINGNVYYTSKEFLYSTTEELEKNIRKAILGENKTLMSDFYEFTMAQTYFKTGLQDKKFYFDVFFRSNPFDSGYSIMSGLDEVIDYIRGFRFEDDDIDYLRSLNVHVMDLIKRLENFEVTDEDIEELKNSKLYSQEFIDRIRNCEYTIKDIEYIKSQNILSEDFLEYLTKLKFTGTIKAIPDGTPVFPNEPVMTVVANSVEAQIVETAILASFNYACLVTTISKRITEAATKYEKDKLEKIMKLVVMEFGARRARGIDGAILASKYAYIGGCAGTSNTYAGKKYGIPVLGTMAHCSIEAYNAEYEAFLKYAKSNPNNCVFLVDTYDTLKSGIPNAIRVANDYLIPNGYKFKGIRIDSGDLAYLSKEARRMLDEAGFTDTKICLSNGLDERTIASLLQQGAYVDSFGVGDNIAAAKERMGGVYKLVAINDGNKIIPKIKISNDEIKTINSGYKRVYRFYDKKTGYALGDVIALSDEDIPNDGYMLVSPTEEWKTKYITDYEVRELQIPIFVDGELVYNSPSVKERKDYCAKQFDTLYPEIKRIDNPHGYYVDLSSNLLTLKKGMIKDIRKKIDVEVRNEKGKVRRTRVLNRAVTNCYGSEKRK